jgi:Flp pilus assembly pilin Flp
MSAITKKNLRKSRGQGMTEYIIIVALIAIAAVGVVTVFGNNIRSLFGASAKVLSGADAKNEAKAAPAATLKKNMKNFGENNATAY